MEIPQLLTAHYSLLTTAHLDTKYQRQGQREDDQEGGEPRQYDGTRSGPGGVG